MTDIPDQKYQWATDKSGRVKNTLETMLAVPNCPKTAVTFTIASALSPLSGKFARQGMVPVAAIEKAKKDQDFNMVFVHCLGHSYREDILAQARAENVCKCHGCQEPATKVAQVPTGSWFEDPPTVVESAGFLLCDNPQCDAKAKQDFMNTINKLQEFNQKCKEETDTQQCDNCTKVGTDMMRCSQCKVKFYCCRDCQKRAWSHHHRAECKPSALL